MASKKKPKIINTISAISYQRDVPNADASLVKDDVKRVNEIIKEVPVEVVTQKEVPVEVIKEVEVVKEVIREVPVEVVTQKEVPVEVIKEVEVVKEVIKEVPVEVIKEKEIIREVPVEIIREVEVIKEVIREVPVEIIREVEVIKEVIREVPIEINKSGFSEYISDLKMSYAGTSGNSEPENKLHEKITQVIEEPGDDVFYLDEVGDDDEYKPDDEIGHSETQVNYIKHAATKSYELYFKNVCVYSSLTHRIIVSFHKEYALVGNKRYKYSDGLVMKFYNN